MSIWFYLFIIVCIITIILVIKIIVMKNGIKEIEEKFDFVIKSDTNSLITISTNDSNLKNLAKKINLNLKKIRKLEIQYNQGNEELKSLHRGDLGLPPRRCFICQEEAKVCGRNRRHSLEAMQEKITEIILTRKEQPSE